MNSESFPENNQSTEKPINPIGPRLKRAREELRLSITDIARQLRLTEERIESLENNDYQDMPGTTFVKGYLRAYARLVNLPADDLILDFERLHLMPEAKSFIVSSYKQPILLSNKSLRWVVYLIGIGLFILAATWWSSSNSNDPANVNASDAKHLSAKNVPATGALTNNTLSIAGSANVAKNPVQGAAANTGPGNTTDTSQSQAGAMPVTSPSSSASPTAPASTPTVSAESSNKQAATTDTAHATIEEASDEPQPRKKPTARVHSRPQMDEPFDDE